MFPVQLKTEIDFNQAEVSNRIRIEYFGDCGCWSLDFVGWESAGRVQAEVSTMVERGKGVGIR